MISLILITDDDDTQTESPSNFMMFFAVSALCCSTNICLSIYPLRMFLQCVRLCCSLFMWHCCAHTLTCIQMIPSMTDKNFRNLPNEMIKTCTTYYMFEVKTKKKRVVHIFLLCSFSVEFFCFVQIFQSVFFALFKLEWRIKKSHSERLTLSWLLLVHDWSKWKCLIGGAKVKLIVFYFDDSNEGWAEKNC